MERRNRALITELSEREYPPAQPFCAPSSAAVEELPAKDNAKQLAALVEFLRRYLVCDEHQFTVLALWIVHTWCFELFSNAPYLNIRFPEPQSGNLCLDLLDLLCRSPWLAPSADSWAVVQHLLRGGSRRLSAHHGTLRAPVPGRHASRAICSKNLQGAFDRYLPPLKIGSAANLNPLAL